jgi:predicted RNase H-like nuclease
VGVLLGRSPLPEIVVGAGLEALVKQAGDLACIGIDMPIGLPADGEREADTLARAYVGRRRSSVFMTPPRAVLESVTYAEANVIAPDITGGKKISQQAWALRQNIARVARVAAADRRLIEVHPEVSFRTMAGAEILYSKTTWNGQMLRRRMLAEEGIVLPDELTAGGDIPPADLLDAAAAAWSARRYATGVNGSFPADAPRGQHGVIWY